MQTSREGVRPQVPELKASVFEPMVIGVEDGHGRRVEHEVIGMTEEVRLPGSLDSLFALATAARRSS